MIGSIYRVAYESFYPLLITEGNYSKAYSVASTLETLTLVMIPVSAFVYNSFGIVPLFAFNVISYAVAAIFETQIRCEEHYIAAREAQEGDSPGAGLARFWADFREGMQYLKSEKGLLAIAIYFLFSSMNDGVGQTVTLPFFKGTYENGEYVYMLVWGAASVSRALGGVWLYGHRMPVEKKYSIALCVYVIINALSGVYLYLPIPAEIVCCAAVGALGVMSYNIRISATQRYVPDEKKGRFNGAFNTLSMVGILLGEAIAGALSLVMPLRIIVMVICLFNVAAAFVFIGGNREEVSKIYNTQD